jgi:hypothetical protein
MSFFFNQYLHPVPGSGGGQPRQAVGKLGGGVEFVDGGHFNGGKLAKVAALRVISPAFQKARCRDIGFRPGGFNELLQQVRTRACHFGQTARIQTGGSLRMVQHEGNGSPHD